MTAGPPPRRFLIDGPEESAPRLVLAHGAGAPMDSELLASVARRLAERGVRVFRFEFPYMRRRRESGSCRPPDRLPVLEAEWRDVVAELGDPRTLVIGGHSMGGRIASRVADELGVAGLVCLSYPFHPPKRPDKLRTAHLEELRTPALFLQGERDPFGTPGEIAGYDLSPAIEISYLPDGDHSLKPRKRSGYSHASHLSAAAERIAEFATAR